MPNYKLVVCCDGSRYDAKIGIYFIYLLPNSSNDRYAHCVTCHFIKVTIASSQTL